MSPKKAGSAAGAGRPRLCDEVKDKERILALFYAAWCPFSIRFLPHFEAYAAAHPGQCRIVEIDEDPRAFEDYAIEVYPTVIEFRRGKPERRLDAAPGLGLNRSQLEAFCLKAP